MKIVVCVKYVPDTAIKIKIASDGKTVNLSDASYVVNHYDEYAVEEALRIKEKSGAEVIVLGAGSEKAGTGLRTCLAMGADSAILVQDEALENADSYTIGAVLARICRELGPDLILCGRSAIGVDNGQVPSVVAELLGMPQVSVIVKLEILAGKFRAEREIEGAREIVEGSLPAAFTAQKDLNTPRYASLKGIMAAKKKTISVRTLDSLGMASEDLQPKLSIEEVILPPARPPGKILSGDVSESVPELVRLLHEEAKII
jgi:electron transfer flavoprotein beta subunit